jgi:hypothetical protein
MAHKTTVVVDGSNVITANIGEKTFFRVNRIINVINKLKKLGYTYKVGMKAKTYNYIIHHAPEEKIDEADKKTLLELYENLEISLLNKDADDHWLHLGAIEFDAYILSHDKFRKEIEHWEEEGRHDFAEEIKNRRITLEFFDDAPIFELPDISSMEILVSDDDDESIVIIDPSEEKEDEIDDVEEEPEMDIDEELEEESEEEDPPVEEGEIFDFVHAEIGIEDTHVKCMLRVIDDERDWMEFDLPLEMDLGRGFFAELLGVSESTESVLAKISRVHFEIKFPGTITGGKSTKKLLIRDLNSTNGTQFDGARLGKIGQIINIQSMTEREGSSKWPTILIGSKLLEIKLGAMRPSSEE